MNDETIRRLWERACAEHLKPSQIFRLASGLAAPDANESDHLESCCQCRAVFTSYIGGELQPMPCPAGRW